MTQAGSSDTLKTLVPKNKKANESMFIGSFSQHRITLLRHSFLKRGTLRQIIK